MTNYLATKAQRHKETIDMIFFLYLRKKDDIAKEIVVAVYVLHKAVEPGFL